MIIGSDRVRARYRADGLWSDRLLHDAVAERAADSPDTAAIVRADRKAATAWSWGDVDRSSTALAARLLDIGVKQDMRIALLSEDPTRFAIALLAASKAGLILVPLSPLSGAQHITDTLEAGQVSGIISDDGAALDLALRAASRLMTVRFLFAFGAERSDGIVNLDETALRSARPDDLSGLLPRASAPGDHCLSLSFGDGGGTGRVFARSHNQWRSAGYLAAKRLDLQERASRLLCPYLAAAPATQFGAIAPWIVTGATLVTTAPMGPNALAQACRLIEATHCLAPASFETAMTHAFAETGDDAPHIVAIAQPGATAEPPADDAADHPAETDGMTGHEDAVAAEDGVTEDNVVEDGSPMNRLTLATALGPAGLLFHDPSDARSIPLGVVDALSLDGTETILQETQIRGVADLAKTLPKSGLVRGELALSGAAAATTCCVLDDPARPRFRLVSDMTLTRMRAGITSTEPATIAIVGRMDSAVQIGGVAIEPLLDDDAAVQASQAGTGDAADPPLAVTVVSDPLLGQRLSSDADDPFATRDVALRRDNGQDWLVDMLGNEAARGACQRLAEAAEKQRAARQPAADLETDGAAEDKPSARAVLDLVQSQLDIADLAEAAGGGAVDPATVDAVTLALKKLAAAAR